MLRVFSALWGVGVLLAEVRVPNCKAGVTVFLYARWCFLQSDKDMNSSKTKRSVVC